MIAPIIRYMIICEDCSTDPLNPQKVNVEGIVCNFHSTDEPPYPLLKEEFCVLLLLTDGYGSGRGKIVCVMEETGSKLFETPERTISFSLDPLQIVGVNFRVRDGFFPKQGMYSVQFWYEGKMVDERPLRMR